LKDFLYKTKEFLKPLKDFQRQIQIHRDPVDVSAVLSTCHAAVVLATHSRLVKSHPHSLIEALACGRPVVVSESLGIADWVRAERCGVVVPEVTTKAVATALIELRFDYERLADRAASVDLTAFSTSSLVTRYEGIYARALSEKPPS
jgi:glycosyltransferase involved in cell wall biosynthesis